MKPTISPPLSVLTPLFTLLVVSQVRAGAGTGTGGASFPVRGLHLSAPGKKDVPAFAAFVREVLPREGVNTLIVEFGYGFDFRSRPELSDPSLPGAAEAKEILEACRAAGIELIPQLNCLGHQSWARRNGRLLEAHPELDETPGKFPANEGIYCRSYCPLHPKAHEVVFALIDELAQAFEAKAFHVGLDEVFILADPDCPRCGGKDPAELFAGEVKALHAHLKEKGRRMWMWGDRLLDGKGTGIGKWEASENGTHPAIDLVPKDVVICDWHYEKAHETARVFAEKGFEVVSCPWRTPSVALAQLERLQALRRSSDAAAGKRALGMVQTTWCGFGPFARAYRALEAGEDPGKENAAGAARSFRALFRRLREGWSGGVLDEPYGFSFLLGGRSSAELLGSWRVEEEAKDLEGGRRLVTSSWTDAASGLRVTREALRFEGWPAADWVLHLENRGERDTPVVSELLALDATLEAPEGAPFVLHRTNGAPSNPTDFEPRAVPVEPGKPQALGAGGGRSSNRDFPFFKVAAGADTYVVAVGWSGQWAARLESPGAGRLRVAAGMERTHFVLRPGEKVRSPRMLVLRWPGDAFEAGARFRRLIHERYAARRAGKEPLPVLFSNTCFTRGGGWLNETNAANQISLIEAYAPLGLEAVITDAGWFEGGWPAGAGNWTPRKDAYPEGMGPVAAAARDRGMVYGLWFEPERVVAGTAIDREHPEWVLAQGGDRSTRLLNLGLPEVREHLFRIVKGFMDLPGFRVYRQDFNMDPLPFWRANDPPDRQGITEIRYIEGLYAYWDRIASEWPDALREECASGGRRIDLETLRRMHIHQESDYWFDDDVDQAQVWGLSQYLPNGLFTTPLIRLDDYSFHSTLATSLCIGWIADAHDFDRERARKLLDRYREVRHLLTGDWYPLLPYSRDPKDWMAWQHHRPDLGEGLVLAFRRAESPYASVRLPLRGLDAAAAYELTRDPSGGRAVAQGKELLAGLEVRLPERRSSQMVVYRRAR